MADGVPVGTMVPSRGGTGEINTLPPFSGSCPPGLPLAGLSQKPEGEDTWAKLHQPARHGTGHRRAGQDLTAKEGASSV